MYNVDIVSEEIYVHDRQTGQATLASVASDGSRSDEGGRDPALSAEDRYVVFTSDSWNLTPSDGNYLDDIFVHDRQTGATERVSNGPAGDAGNGNSFNSSLSADGRFVAFASDSSDLVPNDTNDETDIFVHDRETGQTIRVSVDSTGAQSDAPGSYHSKRGACSISGDARFVVFASDAPNLVPADTNGAFDVFVHDLSTSQTTRVSVDSDGNQANADSWFAVVSTEGQFVAFASSATNLAGPLDGTLKAAFVHDRDADGNGVFDETCAGCRRTSRVDVNLEPAAGPSWIESLAVSGNGRFIAFERIFDGPMPSPSVFATYRDSDVFVHDRQTGETRRVSVDVPGVRVATEWSLDWGAVNLGTVNLTGSPRLPHEGDVVVFVGELSYSYQGDIRQVFVERWND
jgi:hypothetical protein